MATAPVLKMSWCATWSRTPHVCCRSVGTGGRPTAVVRGGIDLGARPVRRVQVGSLEPGVRRHEPGQRHLRPRRWSHTGLFGCAWVAKVKPTATVARSRYRRTVVTSRLVREPRTRCPAIPTAVVTPSSAIVSPTPPDRVSLGQSGVQAYGATLDGRISADGRYVAFSSAAPNLVPQDTDDRTDVFVRDRRTHLTQRASLVQAHAQVIGTDDFVGHIRGWKARRVQRTARRTRQLGHLRARSGLPTLAIAKAAWALSLAKRTVAGHCVRCSSQSTVISATQRSVPGPPLAESS